MWPRAINTSPSVLARRKGSVAFTTSAKGMVALCSLSPWTMPPYRFLFEKRRIERARSPDALDLPPGLAPGDGYEIVPTQEAKALAAYLISLRADAPLFETPMTVPAVPETNAPAATNLPAGPAVNSTSPARK